MAKRNAAAPKAPAIDEIEDAEDLPGVDPDDEDDDDLWDEDDDDEDDAGADAGHEDDRSAAGDDDEEAAAVDVAMVLQPFTTSTLPKRMLRKTLGDQSNEWVLSTIGRLVDEFRAVSVEARDKRLACDLELLMEAADLRDISRQLPEATNLFACGVVDWLAIEDDVEQTVADENAATAESETDDAPSHEQAANSLAVEYVARDAVHPDPLQPRQHADAELRESIRALGIMQPIIVRRVRNSDLADRAAPCGHCATPWAEIAGANDYVIVDGERRWQGSEGVLEMVPVIMREDQGDTYERLRTQLVANTGKPLSPIEEAHTFARMLESRETTIAQLARDIGRPPSTVHDRVKLLELGPWVPWIENGSVTVSMAVEHLVPLRGIPDEFHADALARLMEEYGPTPGEPFAEDVDGFGQAIASAYDKFMYPLSKTKNDYEKQPRFNTKAHDAECTCGGIHWAGSWHGVDAKARKHCGNPAWWKPLDAAAKKEERQKDAGADKPAKKGELRLELPEGTPTIKTVGYSSEAPKGVVMLTGHEGKWAPGDRWHLRGAFDPADLVIDETKLVRVKSSYGVDKVGSKDIAAVEAARTKFRARFEPQRAAAAKKLLAEFEKLESEIYAVKGPGTHALLSATDMPDAQLREIAELLGIAVPDKLGTDEERSAGRSPKLRDEWVAKTLKRKDAERLVSFLAFLQASDKRKLPRATIAASMQEAVDAIAAKRAPWFTTKAPKPAAKSKKAGGGGR